MRKLHLINTGELPVFQPQSPEVQDKSWQVLPVPHRLQCRTVDLGDISPANTELFTKALISSACGIQVLTKKFPQAVALENFSETNPRGQQLVPAENC